MTPASTQAPLGGMMVVDFTHLVAGPFCTMLLADAGADVVKIEPPWGDHSRMRGPTRQEGEVSVSSYLAAGNRGKRSLALNLKTQGGHSAAEELLERADIVIENFAPGVISRMGFDFNEFRARRPEVITASISLFGGQAGEGRLAGRPGLAIVAESESGLASLCRDSQGMPIPFGFVLGDIASGLAAYGAIVTALLHRQVTGIGRHIDIAMVHTLMAFNGIAIAGQSLGNDSDRPLPTSPYGYFVARDGFVSHRGQRRPPVGEIYGGHRSTRTCVRPPLRKSRRSGSQARGGHRDRGGVDLSANVRRGRVDPSAPWCSLRSPDNASGAPRIARPPAARIFEDGRGRDGWDGRRGLQPAGLRRRVSGHPRRGGTNR